MATEAIEEFKKQGGVDSNEWNGNLIG
jgi:hypothetical protein